MSNDEKKRGWKSGTQRDLEAERRLKAQRAASKSELDRAVADDAFDESPTPVQAIQEIDTGMTPRIAADEDMHRLFVRSEHNRDRIEDARKDAANRILSAMGEIPPAEAMSKLEKTIRQLRWVVVAIAIPAASSFILAGKYIYSRAVDDTRKSVYMERLVERVVEDEKKIDILEGELRTVEQQALRNSQRIDDLRPR